MAGMVIPGSSEWYMAQQRWPNDAMYHYTSRAALENILAARRMWATDLRVMNDPHELRYSAELIQQRFKAAIRRHRNELKTQFLQIVHKQFRELIAEASISYGISFSEHHDLAHQWRDYAENGSGFVLGWSIDSPCPEVPLRMWVTYERAKQKQMIDGLIEFHLNWIRGAVVEHGVSPETAFANAGLSLAIYMNAVRLTFKSKDWSRESEFRYVYQYFTGYEPPGQVFRSRFANGIEKRYIEADFRQVELRQLVIGPRNDLEPTAKWLRELLDREGFKATRIVRSHVDPSSLA